MFMFFDFVILLHSAHTSVFPSAAVLWPPTPTEILQPKLQLSLLRKQKLRGEKHREITR